MINFVLDDLCSPTGGSFGTRLKLFVLPLNFNGLIKITGAKTTKQGKATLLGVIRSGHFDNVRVEHCRIYALVIKYNDPFTHADHIGCQTYAGFFVCSYLQCIKEHP